MKKFNIFILFFLIIFSALLIIFYRKLTGPSEYLVFSDGAKYADVARNIVMGSGYGTNFSFFGQETLRNLKKDLFPAGGILPVMPLSISGFFKLMGIKDFSVIATSTFYYVLLVIFVFLLGKKLFGSLVGFLSAVAVAANINFLDYATSGASEPLLAFEIVLAAYLFSIRKKWSNLSGFLVLILMYFSRPLSFIFITGLLIYWLLLNFDIKKTMQILLYSLVGALIVELVFSFVGGKSIFYPIYIRGLQAANFYPAGEATSNAIRGGIIEPLGALGVAKKAFYNLYNFYKALPSIASPYMWGLFVIGLFKWSKDLPLGRQGRAENSLKAATIFMVLLTFLVTALTIPFYRYLHPVIPLVYLFATATLVTIVAKISNFKFLISKQAPIFKFQITKNSLGFRIFNLEFDKEKTVALISSILIFFFVVGQTLGVIFLDSRFAAARTNKGKPPVYVQLSYILKDNTNPDEVVVTNLDTWGSWYGERKTVWFPLEPNQLSGLTDEIDAIYLTSYLLDDENYYMGDNWRDIFENPENHENDFIAKNYELAGVYEVKAADTYERQEARAVLFIRK